jgi:hypothetical protein
MRLSTATSAGRQAPDISPVPGKGATALGSIPRPDSEQNAWSAAPSIAPSVISHQPCGGTTSVVLPFLACTEAQLWSRLTRSGKALPRSACILASSAAELASAAKKVGDFGGSTFSRLVVPLRGRLRALGVLGGKSLRGQKYLWNLATQWSKKLVVSRQPSVPIHSRLRTED